LRHLPQSVFLVEDADPVPAAPIERDRRGRAKAEVLIFGPNPFRADSEKNLSTDKPLLRTGYQKGCCQAMRRHAAPKSSSD